MEKSKPNRLMILFIWTFLGGIAGVGIVFGRTFVQDMKGKWNSN
jgi:LPS O-antigen subunit length determinant protein (WzzB/FepE family)